MSVRLIISLNAAPGRGSEFAQALRQRCEDVQTEPGCEQFEVFQSALDPNRLVLLELWADDAALAAHSEMNKTRAPLPAELRGAPGGREDYVYAKTA